jgi:hypothetical protein
MGCGASAHLRASSKYETVVKDTTGDGKYDTIYQDTTGDGKYDTAVRDTTGDGNVDRVEVDTTGDGNFDLVKFKPNFITTSSRTSTEASTHTEGDMSSVESPAVETAESVVAPETGFLTGSSADPIPEFGPSATAGTRPSRLTVMSFNMEIRQAGYEEVMKCVNEIMPDILFTQEDLSLGKNKVHKGVERIMAKYGKAFEFRAGPCRNAGKTNFGGLPLEGFRRLAEASAETADWIDQTKGVVSGMRVANKIYVRRGLSCEVLASGCLEVVTLDKLVRFDCEVPPRATPFAVIRYEDTVACLISAHLSGGRFDDELIKSMLDGIRDASAAEVEAALELKSTQLKDVVGKVYAAVNRQAAVHLEETVGRSILEVSRKLRDMEKAKPRLPLPPIDLVVLGGDCNSYGREVTSLRTDANPQFGYACKVLFGEYEENARKVDQFLRYQTVRDEIPHDDWTLRRVRSSSAPTARSSIYGGIVDHFFVHAAASVDLRELESTVEAQGLAADETGSGFLRKASDHNPVRLTLAWEFSAQEREARRQHRAAMRLQAAQRGLLQRKASRELLAMSSTKPTAAQEKEDP